MSDLFKISEFAKHHGISRRTLIHYDQINLLSPFKIDENGYRYYSASQNTELSTILTLRELGIPLNQIQRILSERNPHLLDKLYQELIVKIDHHIKLLEGTKYALNSRLEKHHFFENLTLNTPFLSESLDEEYIQTTVPSEKFTQNFLDNYGDLSTDLTLVELLDAPDLLDGKPWGFRFIKDDNHPSGYRPKNLLKLLNSSNKSRQFSKDNQFKITGTYVSLYLLNQPNNIKNGIQQLKAYGEKEQLILDSDYLHILVWKDEIETPHLTEHILELSFRVLPPAIP